MMLLAEVGCDARRKHHQATLSSGNQLIEFVSTLCDDDDDDDDDDDGMIRANVQLPPR